MFNINVKLICFVTFVSIISANLPPEYLKRMETFSKECLALHPEAKFGDLTAFVESKLPKDFKNWCFIACVSKKLGFTRENNTLEMKKLEERLDFIKTTNPELHKKQLQLLTYCSEVTGKTPEPDECKHLETLYKCTSEKAKELKLDRII